MNWTSAREGVLIALEALRSNKVRAALTILGVVIGVTTVVGMASAIGGFRSSILNQIKAIGPRNFVVQRFEGGGIQVDDGTGKPPWWNKPKITMAEVDLLSRLPSIRSVATAVSANGEVRSGAKSISGVALLGRSSQWVEYSTGDFVEGRNFLPADEDASEPVIVLSRELARTLFEGAPAVGKRVRAEGAEFRVIGVYDFSANIFAQAQKNLAIMPTTAAVKRVKAKADFMSLLVVPSDNVTQDRAIDDVTAALRVSRGLKASQENNFAITRQEQIANQFDKLTGIFFIVMVVLAGVGLIVGGVGVIGIMMISVTERTREIGVRKALGATPREILWQFLVESMTVTVIGGAIGLAGGGLIAWVIRVFTPIPAAMPLWSVVAALVVAAFSGIVFGLYPANKAARLDPVDALRYE
jgi:putative ABC transport system permease protein